MKIEIDDIKSLFPKRDINANKGDFGYIALIGGSIRYSGAIRLANMASASLISGAGVVKLATPRTLVTTFIPLILESTLYPLSEVDGHILFKEEEFLDLSHNLKSIAIGMGIENNNETKKAIKWLLKNYKGNLIIDADGLNALSELIKEDNNILLSSNASIILTPHLKEFSRLINKDIEEIKSKPLELAREFAKKNHVIVVLKGHTTYVCDDNDYYEITCGNPGMAKAGSGDVLSGILASITVNNAHQLLKASAGAVYINGLAGDLARDKNNEVTMLASDTADNVREVLNNILNK